MPPQMFTRIPENFSYVPYAKWLDNEFTISLYSTYYVAFDVRNYTKMKIKAFSSYNGYTSALFSDSSLNTNSSTSNTLIRTFLSAITTPIEIDISSYNFITLCTYGSGSVRYAGFGGLFTGLSFE